MTLLFIHGAGFTGECFSEQTAAFPGSLAPNLPGHLEEGEAHSVSDSADFIARYIEERSLSDVVLCGHSMGGAVALELALRRHPALRGLVLLGSGGRLRVAPAVFDRMQADFEEGARFIAGFFFAEPSPERIDWAVASMRAVGAEQTLRDFRACDAFDVLPRLGEIALPLLAFTGEQDRMTPPKFAQAFADRVPGAETRIVSGAGHLVMVERPAETNAAVAAFLRRIA